MHSRFVTMLTAVAVLTACNTGSGKADDASTKVDITGDDGGEDGGGDSGPDGTASETLRRPSQEAQPPASRWAATDSAPFSPPGSWDLVPTKWTAEPTRAAIAAPGPPPGVRPGRRPTQLCPP